MNITQEQKAEVIERTIKEINSHKEGKTDELIDKICKKHNVKTDLIKKIGQFKIESEAITYDGKKEKQLTARVNNDIYNKVKKYCHKNKMPQNEFLNYCIQNTLNQL